MNTTGRLQEVATRLTPEQYARLLSYAETLASETDSLDVDSPETLQKNFPANLRLRLRELTAKSEAETLTKAERAEYILLAEQLEEADAKRIETAIRLSKSKNISFAQALAELDKKAN